MGSGKVDLSAETLTFLENLTEDMHIQVFVTPTCPYCPRAVILAHHLAFASAKVHADMVEATEFPELSSRFNVMGVPRSVINGKVHQEGAVPEAMFLLKMQEAVGSFFNQITRFARKSRTTSYRFSPQPSLRNGPDHRR